MFDPKGFTEYLENVPMEQRVAGMSVAITHIRNIIPEKAFDMLET